MPLEAGAVVARLGARLDDDAFDRFERRLNSARQDARNDVEVPLKADVDERGFRRFDDRMDQTERRSRRFGAGVSKSLGGLRFAAFGAATAGAAAAGILGKTFIGTAASIGESTSKIRTVLGVDAAGALEDFAKTSARTLGLSRASALEAGGSFASMFKLMGQSSPEAAKMSERMVTLAADMASFNNASPEEALTALQSGLRGEAEPLRRFNVLLDDATLRQQAVKDGLIATTNEALTPQQKAMAAYGVILKQTETQQGDFARTSEGLPNQLRTLRARFSDLGASIGEKLLPVATKATSALNDLLSGGGDTGGRLAGVSAAIRSAFAGVGDFVGDFVKRNRDNLNELGDAFAGIGRSIGRLLRGIGNVFRDVFGGGSGIRKDLDQIVDAFAAFQAFMFRHVYEPIVRRVIPGIVTAFKGLALIIRGVVRVIAGILTLDFAKAWDGVKDIFGGVGRVLGGLLRAASAPIRAAAALIWRGISAGAEAAWDFITGIFNDGLDFIMGGVTSLLGVIESMLRVAGHIPGVGNKFDDLADSVRGAKDDLNDYRESLRETDEQHGRTRNIRRLKSEVSDLRGQLRETRRGTEEYRDTAERLRKKQGELNRAMRLADPAGRKGARGPEAMAGSTENLVEVTEDGFVTIAGLYNDLAGQIGGIDEIKLRAHRTRRRSKPRRTSPGSDFGPGPGDEFLGGGDNRFERGGYLGAPGQAGRDDRLVMAAPGEAFLTRHHQGPVELALAVASAMGYGVPGSLGELFTDRRAHGAPGFQRGGRVPAGIVPIPGQPGEFIHSSILKDVVSITNRYRARVTDGYATSGHAAGGEHPKGLAVDLIPGAGGNWDLIDQLARWAEPQQNRPRHPFRWVGYTGDANHGRGNHLHLSWKGAGASLMGALDAVIDRVLVDGPGGRFRELAQGAIDRIRKGGNRRLAAASAAPAGGVGGGPNFGGGRFVSTAYGPPWGGIQGTGVTATGVNLRGSPHIYGVAVDPRVIPLGSKVRVSPNPFAYTGAFRAFDTGGAIKGKRIDFYDWRGRQTQNAWGRRPVRVEGFERGGFVGRGGEGLTGRGRRYITGRANAVSGLERTIGRLGRRYELRSRAFDLTDETFVFEGDENTPPSLDKAAIERKLGELQELRTIRIQIRDAYASMVRGIDRILRVYRTARDRVQRALAGVERRLKRLSGRKGKEAERTRKSLTKRAGTYRERLSDYRGRFAEWSTEREDADYERQTADLDARELGVEIRDIDPSRLLAEAMEGWTPPEPAVEAEPEGAGETAEPAQAAPTAEQIAAAAAEQLASFQAGRASLFGGFGANFVAPGARGPGGGILAGDQLAAGTRYFGGGAGGSEGGVIAAAGGITVQGPLAVFTGPAPADPHTFTRATLHELQAAI